jgi:hypothetical protein
MINPICTDKCVRALTIPVITRHGHTRRIVADFLGIRTDSPDAATKIGRLLYTLNAEAVAQRYNEEPSTEGAHYVAFAREQETASRIVDLKALACLRYQCREGNVDKSPTFAELSRVIGEIAFAILSEAPQYEAAAWG